MTSIVVVEKSGTVKNVKAKDVSRETLYSKCGFRKADGFEKRTVWKVELDQTYMIELWSRNDGKANTENKYDFPPPVDKDLYFGNCCVICIDEETDTIIDLTTSIWNKIYEKLFGGFEDLDDDEEPSEDELEGVPASMKTHSGYLKDGFVVGTDSDSDGSYVEEAKEEPDESSGETEEDDANAHDDSGDDVGDNDDTGSDASGSELEPEKYYYSDED